MPKPKKLNKKSPKSRFTIRRLLLERLDDRLLLTSDGINFAVPDRYPAADAPERIVTADFDRDGILDIAVWSEGIDFFDPNPSVSILFGQRSQKFTSAVTYSAKVGQGSSFQNSVEGPLLAQDIDQDDDPDLVFRNYSGIGTLRNRGDGTFEAATLLASNTALMVYPGMPPSAIVDLDRDGDLDVIDAAVDGSTWAYRFYSNDGDGNLAISSQSGEAILTLHDAPSAIIGRDLNNDQHLDLIVTSSEQASISIFINLGTNTFASGQMFTAAAFPMPAKLADMNEDSILDIVVVSESTAMVRILYGQSNGSYDIVNYPQQAFDSSVGSFEILDIDLDRRLDIALGYNVGMLQILRREGQQFTADTLYSDRAVDGLYSVDLFDDDLFDLIGLDFLNDQVSTFLNQGDGSLLAARAYQLDDAVGESLMGDFNSDGRLDLAHINYASLTIRTGEANGEYRLRESYSVEGNKLLAADFNRDGRLDLLAASSIDGKLTRFLNNNDTGFIQDKELEFSFSDVFVADMDADGWDDILAFSSDVVRIYWNTKNGSFTSSDYPLSESIGFSLSLADFDGDGLQDLLRKDVEGKLTISHGGSNRTFSDPVALPIELNFNRVDTADVDTDGHIDIVFLNDELREITVYFNDRLQSFASSQTYPTSIIPTSVKFADLDRDGKSDLIIGGGQNLGAVYSGGLTVMRGLGDRRFEDAVIVDSIRSSSFQLQVFDTDNDIDLELITTEESGKLTIWHNRSSEATRRDSNFQVSDVTINGTPSIGQRFPIQYSVRNTGDDEATGTRIDSFYLSTDDSLGSEDLFIGHVQRSDSIASEQQITVTSHLLLPFSERHPAGQYRVIVKLNSNRRIYETAYGDNVTASNEFLIQLPITPITFETPLNSQLSGDESQFFRLDVVANSPVLVETSSNQSNAILELTARQDRLPVDGSNGSISNMPLQAAQAIFFPASPVARTYFLRVSSLAPRSLTIDYRIQASIKPFTIITQSFGIFGNRGQATIDIRGVNLTDTIRVALIDEQNRTTAALRVWQVSDRQLFASFNVQSLAVGTYSVKFEDDLGNNVTIRDSLTIEAVSASNIDLQARVILPSRIRSGLPTTARVEFRNVGKNDLPVPLFTLSATGGVLAFVRKSDEYRPTLRLLGIGNDGPVDVLRPGQSVTRTFFVKAGEEDSLRVGLSILREGSDRWNDATDWRPLLPSAWQAKWTEEEYVQQLQTYQQRLGRTYAEYVRNMRKLASIYDRVGERIIDAEQLESWLLAIDLDSDSQFSMQANRSRPRSVLNKSSTESHPTSVYAFDRSVGRWRTTPLSSTDIDPSLPTDVLIHGWKNSIAAPWMLAMAKEIAKKGPRNILGIDWGDLAQTGDHNPWKSAENAVGAAETAYTALINSSVPASGLHLIGHSHGAHLGGLIANKFKEKVRQLTALDPSEEFSHINSNGNQFGINWGAEKETVKYVVVYKSSQILGGETAWGHDNFLLAKKGSAWSGIAPNQGEDHGYAVEWFTDTIREPGPFQLGYYWKPDSWTQLQQRIQGLSINEGQWRGLIRGEPGNSVIEVFSQAADNPNLKHWNYPGSWVASRLPTNRVETLFDGETINNMIKDLAKARELEVVKDSFEGPSEWKAAKSEELTIRIQNNVDNLSLRKSDRIQAQKNAKGDKVKFYLSLDDKLGNDISLGEEPIPILIAVDKDGAGELGKNEENEASKLMKKDISLPSKKKIENNFGIKLPLQLYLLIDVGSQGNEYPNELFTENNFAAFAITVNGEDLASNPGGPYIIEDSDGDGRASLSLNGIASEPAERILSYQWRNANGATLGEASIINSTFTVGTHQVALKVRDEDGEERISLTVVDVRPKREEPIPKPEYPDASSKILRSYDPNDILGPAGVGERQFVSRDAEMPYTIRFENDPQKATAPAAIVVIEQTLDIDLDWTSFRLGDIGFGSHIVDIPDNLAVFRTRFDASASMGLWVDIDASIDLSTGRLTWRFLSIDPATGDIPEDPLIGFLPPNQVSPKGEGFVSYIVRPKSNSPTGTRIDAQASIVFDTNSAIITPPIFNTLDAAAPQSRLNPLAKESTDRNIKLEWSGIDDTTQITGVGIGVYNVFVSVDGGSYTAWRRNVAETSATYRAEVGKVYGFYVTSIDQVGHPERKDSIAEYTTRIVPLKWQNPNDPLDVNNDKRITPSDALLIINHLNQNSNDSGSTFPDDFKPPFLDVSGNDLITPSDALIVINYLNSRTLEGESAGEGPSYSIYSAQMFLPILRNGLRTLTRHQVRNLLVLSTTEEIVTLLP